MRGKLRQRREAQGVPKRFNEARALCAGSFARKQGGIYVESSFNEARALCAGSSKRRANARAWQKRLQ